MASVIILIFLNFIRNFLLTWCYVVRLWRTFLSIGQRKVVPPIRDELLLVSATKMAELIRERKVKSFMFVSSYITRIREVNPYINAVVEDRFEEALEEARAIDSMLASGCQTVKQTADETPLLGVPITVKLAIEVGGMRSSSASKYFAYRFAEEDADAMKLLKKAGAIIIATTNIPEFSVSIDTSNKLYGRTGNPFDTTKTAGGSSGGECALISSAGSILGIGSDIGGSLRIPANFCGIFAHKPTNGIISVRGHFPVLPEENGTFGPMCRNAEDLLTSMKVLISTKRTKIKLDDPVDMSKIKVFYMESIEDNILIQPMESDVLKKLHLAVAALKKEFHTEPVKFHTEPMKYSFLLALSKIRSSFGKSAEEVFLGERNKISLVSELLKSVIGRSSFSTKVLILLCLDHIFDKAFKMAEKLVEKHLKTLEEHFGSILDENSVLLMPTFPMKSFYCGESILLTLSAGYTAIFNVLGLPVTQCPLGLDENGMMPIGIQIVASKGNDRLSIQCALELEKIFGGWRPPCHLNNR